MADRICQWLHDEISLSHDGKYRHVLLAELPAEREQAINALKKSVEDAYADARNHVREIAGISLDPLEELPQTDIAAGFPGTLTMNTRKGHFGELFAGLIAERLSPLGHTGWKVPAYLFRFHQTAFHELERALQTGDSPKHVIGRPGDDCLAFLLNENGSIEKCLVCEAKCSGGHNAGLVKEAHKNLGDSRMLVPMSIREVIEVLRDDKDKATASSWIAALRGLLLTKSKEGYERCDMICYICGKRPIKEDSWIPKMAPHPEYRSSRRLEAVEIHLNDVEKLIEAAYGNGSNSGAA